MARVSVNYLVGLWRMGDPAASEALRAILRRGAELEPGHPDRELARAVAACVALKDGAREAFLPGANWQPVTALAKRLHVIFSRAGGQIHLAHPIGPTFVLRGKIAPTKPMRPLVLAHPIAPVRN